MAIMKGYGVIEPTVSWGWMEKEIPEPGPFEALCSPVAVLPCTSDVHSAHFRNAWPNRILGHEGVGRVEKVGAMVTDIHVGDIVAVPAVTPIWRGRQIAEGLHEHTGGFLGGRYLSSKLDGTFGEYGITVNTLSPGFFASEQSPVGQGWFADFINTWCPMKRNGSDHELDAAIIFMTCEENSYMTGNNVVIDGGWTCT